MSIYKKYKCKTCDHIYDEEKGDPDGGISPQTLWNDVPDDWQCPECGAPKKLFEEVS